MPSPSVARSNWHAPSSGVLSRGALVSLPTAVVEALWKEWEDTLRALEEARREAKGERLAVIMVENIRDAAQVEASHLRAELKGTGHSLPLLLPANPGLRATSPVFSLDIPCSYRCRVEGEGSPLDK